MTQIKEYCTCGSEVPITPADFVDGEFQCSECGSIYDTLNDLMTLDEVNEYHGRI